MGRTVRFDQIYVASLDADPLEQEGVLTSVRSIITSEIEADVITTANLNISGDLASTGDLQLSGFTNVFRFTATQIGVDIANPTNDFQVSDRFSINRTRQDLVIVDGNVASTNLIASNLIKTTNDKFYVDSVGSNVLKVSGNTYSSNLTVGDYLTVGVVGASSVSNIALFQNGNVAIENGDLLVTGNVIVSGNVMITDDLTYKNSNNLVVSNAVIQMADGVPGGVYDNALIMTEDSGVEANIAFGYSTANTELIFAKTFGSAYTIGGVEIGQTIPLDSNTVNIHVYGKLYTDGNVGVANINPTHTLCVGSNVFFDDTASNVMYSSGNVYVQKLSVGTGGIRVGDLLTVNSGAVTPVVINSNVQVNALRTTGTKPSGFSNLSPTDTLSIGSKIFANITNANTLTIVGNTVTTNLTTSILTSSSNILVHADNTGPNSTSNALILKSGPIASNVSSIEIYGASTSNTHQNIRFSTKNSERMRITSNGFVGIANTNPSERLTVSGNIHVTGSNAVIYGNVWGTTGNTAMRVYSSPTVGETRVENIVASGKGINFYASTTPTMGNPKMTILESSNVGIGTSTPQGLFQTSGGTAFINQQVVRRNNYNHFNTPLIVTNTSEISVINSTSNVMQLTREGSGSKYGARAAFKLGKWDMTDNQSRTRLDINLADSNYATDTNIMTIRSDGKVGIGHGEPTAFLEVKCEGVALPGLLVHNHDDGDAIISTKTDLAQGNAFSSYVNGNAGWSVGIAGAQGDFRITNNPTKVSDSGATEIFIGGASGNVGIGTDAPRSTLEVDGNVVIGNKLELSGLAGSLYGNTAFIERRYGASQAQNELVIFKGNQGVDALEGPTRIRHIAAEHLFQTYSTSDQTFAQLEPIGSTIPLRITGTGAVIIGGAPDVEPSAISNKLVVAGNIEFTAGGQFRLTGIEFETTNPTLASGDDSVNIIRNIQSDATGLRPLTFIHEISVGNQFEFARFDNKGHLGVGTETPSTNVHVHNSSTSDSDVLKLTSNAASSGTTKTGMLLYLNDQDGGYMRGYHDVDNDITGLILGSVRNGNDADGIRITHTSNVGIGTTNPLTGLHVYDAVHRIEHSSSNAIIEFKTTGGTSNILSDSTGNVYINPDSTETFVHSNLTIENDLTVGGSIDFGDQVAIGLGGAAANTSLHVNGGIITNSDHVSCKKYSNTFTRTVLDAKDIQLYFGTGAFYAKVVAMMRRTSSSTVIEQSTMVLEIQGGTEDESLSTLDIAIGSKTIFGGTNSYPWSPIVTAGKRGIILNPHIAASVQYKYDIFVELLSSRNGSFDAIYGDNPTVDNTTGTKLITFTY